MSTDDQRMPTIDPRAFNWERAEALALRFASGEPETSLSGLHQADPEAYPSPVIVRRWRSVWPAFDALMRECEVARAAALMDATLGIADDVNVPAANAKNAIAVRWRMAESLAPEIFGTRRGSDAPGSMGDARRTLALLTDAELIAIARGAIVADGGASANDPPGTPHPPAIGSDGGFTGGSEARPPTHSFPARECLTLEHDPGSASEIAPKIEPAVETLGYKIVTPTE